MDEVEGWGRCELPLEEEEWCRDWRIVCGADEA